LLYKLIGKDTPCKAWKAKKVSLFMDDRFQLLLDFFLLILYICAAHSIQINLNVHYYEKG